MSFMKERVEEIIRKSGEIAERLDRDKAFKDRFFDAPQDTLIEAGLPPIAIGAFLKASGFPSLSSTAFTPSTVAHFEAAAMVEAEGECNCFLCVTIHIGCAVTLMTRIHETTGELGTSEDARRIALDLAGLSSPFSADATDE